MSDIEPAVLNIMTAICKPLVRFCMRNALGVQQAMEALKKTFIEVARESIEEAGHTANVSRLSIATGLHRRDVLRLVQNEKAVRQTPNALSRIIAAWETHPKFSTKNGTAKVLSYEGKNNEFDKLVRLITSDLHPGTVYFQLAQMGVVETTPHGLKLNFGAEVIRNNPQKAYQLLANDMADLPLAVEENIAGIRETPHLHARTEYDNVLQEALPEIEQWLLKEGSMFHQRARNYISQFDADLHPHKKGAAKSRAALVTFSITVKPDQPAENQESADETKKR